MHAYMMNNLFQKFWSNVNAHSLTSMTTKAICSKHKSMNIDLFSVKTIQTLTSYHALIPFKFHEAILRVNFRPSAVLASGLTSVGNEVSVPSGRVSMVSSFLGGAFFPFPPLPFYTQVVERYSVLHACNDVLVELYQ